MADEETVVGEPDNPQGIRDAAEEGGDAVVDEASDDDNVFEGKTTKELKRMVKEAREQSRHFQSVGDRHYNDLKREFEELKAGLSKPKQDQAAEAVSDPEAEEAFVKEWTDKIELDHGKNTIAFVRGAMQDVLALATERARKIVEDALGPVAQRVQGLDPDYRQNQARVDQLVKDYGMPRDKAVLFAKEESAGKKTAGDGQPDRAKIPGASRDGERRVSAPAATSDSVPGDFARFLEMSNLGDEFKTLTKKEARRG